MWGGVGEAPDELVDVSDALNGSQGAAVPGEYTMSIVPGKGKGDGYPVM